MSNPKIFTYTIVRKSTEAFSDRVPYCTAILELGDGSRTSALLNGYHEGMDISIGMCVTPCGTPEHPAYTL